MVASLTMLGMSRLKKFQEWFVKNPYLGLTLMTIAALAPFLAKPFNIDDPLFVWAARQIQIHPANPYGFDVNWAGYSQPMWAAMQNPPLMSYYLAIAASFFGWSEFGLHFACLLVAVMAVLGTYRLAGHLCHRPMFAALAVLFTPGFFVSATTIMCDVLMLACWVWAAVFWMEGLKQNNFGKLAVAGLLMALAALTKYNGICLIPLLAAYGWLEKRNLGSWAICLLIPVAALCTHEGLTFLLYGQPHLLASHQYAQTHRSFQGHERFFKALSTLTFAGGCFAITAFCLPWLWNRRGTLLIAGIAALFLALAATGGMMSDEYNWLGGGRLVAVEFQVWLWTAGGVSALALALAEVWKKRDTASWLLALWLFGIFVFAAFVYWMVNARIVLPMAPAVSILIARRLELNRSTLPVGIQISIVASAVLSLLAAQADFLQANTTRAGASQICARYAGRGNLWFKGHLGFQYYMQQAGAVPLDFNRLELAPGDLLAMQMLNSDEVRIAPQIIILHEAFSLPDSPWISTMSPSIGAGFYSQLWGPLPFAFGVNPKESFCIYILKKPETVSH